MKASSAVEAYGGIRPAARALGIPYSTFYKQLMRERGTKASNGLEFPTLPDKDLRIEDVIAQRQDTWQRRKAHEDAALWQKIKVEESLPYGIAIMGDCHLDDDSCNWDELLADVAVMRDTEGVYAINVGDYTNNWVGRLTALYAEQESSKHTGRRLAHWLLVESGITWAAVVTGNHDAWNEGNAIIREMVGKAHVNIPVHDWTAKIEICTPKGTPVRINASHDFKGKNQFSTTHGLVKEAIWFQDGADILCAGHIHFGGLQQVELPGGHTPWLVRVRGYKWHDEHALVNGFHEGQAFGSVMAIVDPTKPKGQHIFIVPSLQQGAEILTQMRATRKRS